MGSIASQITSLTIIYPAVYSDAEQTKHQRSVSLAFVRGIHRSPVNSPHKWPVTRKMFPFDDIIISCVFHEKPLQMYETVWSYTRHETPVWWRHRGPVTSQSTDLIKWPFHPYNWIEIDGHMDTCNKEPMTPRCRILTPAQLCLMYLHIDKADRTGVLVDDIHHFAQITVLCVVIMTRTTRRYQGVILDWNPLFAGKRDKETRTPWMW